ncbi:MAG: hypothetical protein ACKO5K_13545, partial [Armatimonadota bacterium]
MSRNAGADLHVEWSPDHVRWWNPQNSTGGEGDSLRTSVPGDAPRQVLVGIARTHALVKVLRLPRAGRDDLRRLITAQLSQHSALPADAVDFDFVQTDFSDAEGTLTLLALVRKSDLRQLAADLTAAGLTPKRIAPVAFAAHSVCRDGAGLVVDTWMGSPTHDVVEGGVLRTSRTADPDADTSREIARTLATAGVSALPIVDISREGGLVRALHRLPEMNLEPQEDRAARERRRVAGRTRFGALLVAAALLVLVLVWDIRDSEQAIARRGEGTWARNLGKLRSIRKARQAEAERTSKTAAALSRAFDIAQPLGDIVVHVGDRLPEEVWLTGATVERGKSIQIRGT